MQGAVQRAGTNMEERTEGECSRGAVSKFVMDLF